MELPDSLKMNMALALMSGAVIASPVDAQQSKTDLTKSAAVSAKGAVKCVSSINSKNGGRAAAAVIKIAAPAISSPAASSNKAGKSGKTIMLSSPCIEAGKQPENVNKPGISEPNNSSNLAMPGVVNINEERLRCTGCGMG